MAQYIIGKFPAMAMGYIYNGVHTCRFIHYVGLVQIVSFLNLVPNLSKEGIAPFYFSVFYGAFWCLMVLVEGGRVALVTSQVVLELCEEESCKLVAVPLTVAQLPPRACRQRSRHTAPAARFLGFVSKSYRWICL